MPNPNHLDTINGIGEVTAAVLTAFILDIQHFDTPGKLVAYFGVMPIEVSSPGAPGSIAMAMRGDRSAM